MLYVAPSFGLLQGQRAASDSRTRCTWSATSPRPPPWHASTPPRSTRPTGAFCRIRGWAVTPTPRGGVDRLRSSTEHRRYSVRLRTMRGPDRVRLMRFPALHAANATRARRRPWQRHLRAACVPVVALLVLG